MISRLNQSFKGVYKMSYRIVLREHPF